MQNGSCNSAIYLDVVFVTASIYFKVFFYTNYNRFRIIYIYKLILTLLIKNVRAPQARPSIGLGSDSV